MNSEDARRLALALPDVVERDHHGRPSFRVKDKIFATIWNPTTMNVMVDEPAIHTAVAAHPEWCAEQYWGKRLAAVGVSLDRAPEHDLAELLADAWENRAGRSLS